MGSGNGIMGAHTVATILCLQLRPRGFWNSEDRMTAGCGEWTHNIGTGLPQAQQFSCSKIKWLKTK